MEGVKLAFADCRAFTHVGANGLVVRVKCFTVPFGIQCDVLSRAYADISVVSSIYTGLG